MGHSSDKITLDVYAHFIPKDKHTRSTVVPAYDGSTWSES